MVHKKNPWNMTCSPLMDGEYNRLVPDYESYITRPLDWGAVTDPI